MEKAGKYVITVGRVQENRRVCVRMANAEIHVAGMFDLSDEGIVLGIVNIDHVQESLKRELSRGMERKRKMDEVSRREDAE